MSILEAAKQHSIAVSAQMQTKQAQERDAMQAEVGPKYYQTAQEQLPIIERAIGEIYRPFLEEIRNIRFGASVPSQVQGWCDELARLLNNIPQQLRDGIRGYEQLQCPIWQMDGKSIDLNQRAALIAGTRNLLRSYDGCLTHLDGLKRRIETYLKEWADAKR